MRNLNFISLNNFVRLRVLLMENMVCAFIEKFENSYSIWISYTREYQIIYLSEWPCLSFIHVIQWIFKLWQIIYTGADKNSKQGTTTDLVTNQSNATPILWNIETICYNSLSAHSGTASLTVRVVKIGSLLIIYVCKVVNLYQWLLLKKTMILVSQVWYHTSTIIYSVRQTNGIAGHRKKFLSATYLFHLCCHISSYTYLPN